MTDQIDALLRQQLPAEPGASPAQAPAASAARLSGAAPAQPPRPAVAAPLAAEVDLEMPSQTGDPPMAAGSAQAPGPDAAHREAPAPQQEPAPPARFVQVLPAAGSAPPETPAQQGAPLETPARTSAQQSIRPESLAINPAQQSDLSEAPALTPVQQSAPPAEKAPSMTDAPSQPQPTPPAASSSSVDIDALLADIMGDAAAKAAAEKPDPEAEKRLDRQRRQAEFAARQKQVHASIDRERRRIKMSRERLLIEWLVILLAALVVVFALTQFVFVNAEIPTESMEDTINTGDRVLGYRLAYLSDAPQRGEIIIFRYPDDERQLYVKRIAGLPGEELEIVDGIVYINGVAEPLVNAHIKDPPQGNFGPYAIPEDSYFVLGDNRNRSWDSRYWKNTFVSFEQIVGKATHRFYPVINKLE